ncbi:MAG: ribonuclease PH, partial [Zoogloeaceae bacterium]|jgi:ribonuclease PH|nr:ribonuclease PH [Zoogloeaceae bacterium]
VLQADGGTRCAAITAAWIALHDACARLLAEGKITTHPLRDHIAAVSVGMVGGSPVLDLDYAEDSVCDTDMNIVMTGQGGIVEIQGTAEGAPFTRPQFNTLFDLAQGGIRRLIALQEATLADAPLRTMTRA